MLGLIVLVVVLAILFAPPVRALAKFLALALLVLFGLRGHDSDDDLMAADQVGRRR